MPSFQGSFTRVQRADQEGEPFNLGRVAIPKIEQTWRGGEREAWCEKLCESPSFDEKWLVKGRFG